MKNKLELPTRNDKVLVENTAYHREASIKKEGSELVVILALYQLYNAEKNEIRVSDKPTATAEIYLRKESMYSISNKYKALISFPNEIENLEHARHLVENAPNLVWDVLKEILSPDEITFWLTDLISDFDSNEPWLSDEDDTLEIEVPLSSEEKIQRARHAQNRIDLVEYSKQNLRYEHVRFGERIVAYSLNTQNPSKQQTNS